MGRGRIASGQRLAGYGRLKAIVIRFNLAVAASAAAAIFLGNINGASS